MFFSFKKYVFFPSSGFLANLFSLASREMWSDQRCFLKAVGKRAMYLFFPLNLYPCGWYLGKITSWILFCTMVFCVVINCRVLVNFVMAPGRDGSFSLGCGILEETAINTSTYFCGFWIPWQQFSYNMPWLYWVVICTAGLGSQSLFFRSLICFFAFDITWEYGGQFKMVSYC